MIEYHPLCIAGAPRQLGDARAVELHNFAIARDDGARILGFAVSDLEVSSPILGLSIDKEAGRLWVKPELKGQIYFVPFALIPEDAMQALDQARTQEKPFRIFALPVNDEPDASPVQAAA